MGVATDETTPGLVTCACGTTVAPTLPGGDRPRAHLTPEGTPCNRGQRTGAICKRCGGTPHKPGTVTRGAHEVRCESQVFHPATWPVTIDGAEVTVGNAAACGEVIGTSGEQWQWLTRRPPPGPRRAPEPAGYDYSRNARYWRIADAERFAKTRPGIPGRKAAEAPEGVAANETPEHE